MLAGDSPRDIRAGTRAGARTVGVATGAYSCQELRDSGADAVIEGWEDRQELERVFLS